jgi:DNA invertase Pin-like site-specific DNA recombinase
VSTAEQAISGLGLDAQRATIEGECSRRGWELIIVLEDAGVSGAAIAKRPGLENALDMLAGGAADVLMASRLDRVSRSVLDFHTLLARAQREGWRMALLECGLDTTSPQGEAMVGVSAVFSQLERRLISQRTAAALAVKKANGVRLGRPRAINQKVANRVVEERQAGATLQTIADRLTVAGVPTSQRGSRWYASTVASLLRSVALDEAASARARAQNEGARDGTGISPRADVTPNSFGRTTAVTDSTPALGGGRVHSQVMPANGLR